MIYPWVIFFQVEAHKVISEVLENRIPINPKYCDLGVRVNSVETEFCMEDLKVILNSKNLPNTILLPKVETTEHLNWVNILVSMFN